LKNRFRLCYQALTVNFAVALFAAVSTLDFVRRNHVQPRPPEDPGDTLCRHSLDAVAFARERLGFHPDEQQSIVLDPAIRRGLLNCCRQWGKSTTVAVLAVWKAFHYPGSVILVASPTARQSGEFVRKAGEFLISLGIRPRGDGSNAISLLLPNRSRIIGLPGDGDTTRGYSNVELLVIDEAARVSDSFYKSLRPVIATNERAAIWLMSTPNGRQGFFYEEWVRPDSNWTRIEAPATTCPRISAEYLEEERQHHPDQHFRQEYLCEFVSADFAYFDPEAVADAFRKRPLTPPPQTELLPTQTENQTEPRA
jgi:hypothetical protein